MEPFAIDLHIHSFYSDDGEFSPVELVHRCQTAGIHLMSITDHNCAKAALEAIPEANKVGIHCIAGIEIDCQYKNLDFHLLGYGIDPNHDCMRDIEVYIQRQTLAASHKRLDLVRQLGFSLSEEELYSRTSRSYWKDSWPGELFAEILLDKPEYKNHELLMPYRVGGNRSDNPFVNFYWDYFAQGKPCYTSMIYPDFADAIDKVHQSGGQCVLAHPGNNLKGKFELFDEMVPYGLDGVEVFSNYHLRESTEYFYRCAQKYHLMMTCGSDFHGKTKPSVYLGVHGCFLSKEEILSQQGIMSNYFENR